MPNDGTPERIRVVHLLGSSQPGGVESFILSLAREMNRRAFVLSVVITDADGPAAAKLRECGVDVVLLGRAPRSPADWWRYARVMRQRRGAILHANLGGRAMRAVARLMGCNPLIIHVHAPPTALVPALRNGTTDTAAALRRLAGDAQYVLACSDALTATLGDALPELRARIETLHYGVNSADYSGEALESTAAALRTQLGIGAEVPVVAFIGRLEPQKGIDNLVTISRRILTERASAHVIVAGDGSLRPLLQSLESGPQASRFHFLGWRGDIPALITASDLLVLPSVWEGFPIICIEAAAAARPVAAFAVDGVPEVVRDGETGMLASAGNVVRLADLVLQLVDDPDLRRKLGQAARARVALKLEARFTARRLEEIYATLGRQPRIAT